MYGRKHFMARRLRGQSEGSPPPAAQLRPRNELDAMAANVELTLISIVQGVAIYFLTDSSRVALAELRWATLPYVVTGLALILTVWLRSILHAFTVIRWPLEPGHNFFYIVGAVLQSTLFTQIGVPRRWFPMAVALAVFFLVMFRYERRLYRVRRTDSSGPQGTLLLDALEADHEHSAREVLPVMLGGWAVSAVLVLCWPRVFVTGGWHVVLAGLQAAGMMAYLGSVWQFYTRIAGQIVSARAEWEGPP